MEEILNYVMRADNDFEDEVLRIWDILEEDSSESSSEEWDVEDNATNQNINFVSTIEGFSDDVFKGHMRLKRNTVEFLISRFSESTYASSDYTGGKENITDKAMMYMYIWYVSNTITYRQLSSLFGVSKSSAWKAVRNVTFWLISISHEFIKWPQGDEARRVSERFKQKQQIPGVIGCIDCTHIGINAPVSNKECYFDRKQSYSVILQAVVDAEKKFTDVYCGEPGSLHDSRVLTRSALYGKAERNYADMFPDGSFILGDSAYFGTRWLVPPYKDNGNLNFQQNRFNKRHSGTRIVVENAFGLLKTRFRRLLKFTEHRDLNAVTNLISSICVLHNICIEKDDMCEGDMEHEEQPQDAEAMDEMHAPEFLSRRDELFHYLLEQNLV